MTLAQRLRRALEHETGEDAVLLTGDMRDLEAIDPAKLAAAAVLVPVVDRAEPGIILTQRTKTLRRHPGQIAFPGGRVDARDADPVAAALREAHEEIALPADRVEIAAVLDRYRTGTGFDVTPVIGVVPPDFPYRANRAEVDDVFEVPLAFLLDEANHIEATTEWQGRDRHYYEITWNDYRIWGATAAMIVNLARRLRWTR